MVLGSKQRWMFQVKKILPRLKGAHIGSAASREQKEIMVSPWLVGCIVFQWLFTETKKKTGAKIQPVQIHHLEKLQQPHQTLIKKHPFTTWKSNQSSQPRTICPTIRQHQSMNHSAFITHQIISNQQLVVYSHL